MPIRRMVLRACLTSLVVGGVSLRAGGALADTSDEAGRHFGVGVQAFEEQRFSDAAGEFERAYELKPAWQVLYNLGSVYAALGRPVEAADALERYLQQGGVSIPEDRRRQVVSEVERQQSKIARLDIAVNEPGAEIRVDTQLVGRSPLTLPVRVAAGVHVVEITLDGRKPERREIAVSARESARLELTLTPIVARSAESVSRVAPRPAEPTPHVAPSMAESASHVAPPPSTAPGSSGTGQRVAAYIVGGAGLIGSGIGIALIAAGQNKHLDAVDTANAGDRATAQRLESEADHQKTIGEATVGIGGAAVLGGIILLLSAPSGSAAAAASHASTWMSASSGGFSIKGIW